MAFAKGVTDAQGKLSFRVKPGAHYQLLETQSASGYGTAFGWSSLPAGVEEREGSLLITAGTQGSNLQLKLTNQAHTTDLVFRLFNEADIPMAGAEVELFPKNPTGNPGLTPDKKVTVSADGTVTFPSIRRGQTWYVRYPDNQVMTIEVPTEDTKQPTVTLPDGTSKPLAADDKVSGSTPADKQWALTVKKVIKGGTTPLAGPRSGCTRMNTAERSSKKRAAGRTER